MKSASQLFETHDIKDSRKLAIAAQIHPDRVRIQDLHVQRRRWLGEKIKTCLCQSAVAHEIPKLLDEMQQTLGVRVDANVHEPQGWRLVWRVTFDYEVPWVYSYFFVRRLFAGQELDPGGCHCLGPDWEAPEALLDYGDNDLAQLLSQEEIEIISAAGARTVQVETVLWVSEVRDALHEAFQYAFHRG
ncbi:MAG: hypothetical protein HY326_05080 [Chloroflexi bacterium]|nr:hypothetical protein [Chloroflexota bacterium]